VQDMQLSQTLIAIEDNERGYQICWTKQSQYFSAYNR